MNEHACDFLHSSRDLNAFEMEIQTAKSRVRVAEVLHDFNLTEEDFVNGFPELAKTVQDLPDGASPAP